MNINKPTAYRCLLYVGHNIGNKPIESNLVEYTIKNILSGADDIAGYTLYTGTVFWNGTDEKTTVVEYIIGDINSVHAFKNTGEAIRRALKQEALLFTVSETSFELII